MYAFRMCSYCCSNLEAELKKRNIQFEIHGHALIIHGSNSSVIFDTEHAVYVAELLQKYAGRILGLIIRSQIIGDDGFSVLSKALVCDNRPIPALTCVFKTLRSIAFPLP